MQFAGLRKSMLAICMISVCAIPVSVFAQSCALCYTQAASTSARFIDALRNGILILIVPPLLMSIAITCYAYRKRNQYRGENDLSDSNGW